MREAPGRQLGPPKNTLAGSHSHRGIGDGCSGGVAAVGYRLAPGKRRAPTEYRQSNKKRGAAERATPREWRSESGEDRYFTTVTCWVAVKPAPRRRTM